GGAGARHDRRTAFRRMAGGELRCRRAARRSGDRRSAGQLVIADTAGVLVLGLVVVIVYVVVLWLALAFYVYRDSRQRSTSPSFVLLSTLVGIVPPFLGPLIYFVIRPPHTLEEERSLALEEQALLEPPMDGVITRPCPP